MEQELIERRLNYDYIQKNNDIKETTDIVTEDDMDFSNIDFDKYAFYDKEKYQEDVLVNGLKKTWQYINYYVLNINKKNKFLSWSNFAYLYEIGLAYQDKESKKDFGQYYTPDDVAIVMAKWFKKQKGVNICDVACGTGKLILSYLDLLGKEKAIDLIRNGKLYLYDLDEVALDICKTIILLKYGKKLEPYIHIIHCDFLSKEIVLPENCKVISNPPYAIVETLSTNWDKTDVALYTKELYSMFMEKIIKQSVSSVIITPYSFMGSNKFYSLRDVMNNYNGFIVAFDNVPGNIFCGKKNGIFNSNTSNSVRAAITIVENKNNCKGFKTTPLIRFKNEERKDLLKTEVLESFINNEYQIVSNEKSKYYKCSKELVDIWNSWQKQSSKHLFDYVSEDGQNVISMPNTCRYFTIASNGIMNRKGQIVLKIDDNDIFNYVYCLINSSFAYWYWRMFDGGISYSKELLLSMPLFYDKLTDNDKKFFNNMVKEMIAKSNDFIVTKNNVGVQENIKFPREFRDKINRKMLDILELDTDEKIFDLLHSNMALEVNVK